ncbi:hypothetical protein J132_10846 [Termitomyces sp. J132]|nr:hypothetical protein H2248_010124 [Termitomyces sp. 'cryptogamus']KNZ79297.1 hypothetical protein J132_10846 [Termitomyces sp. J132]
MKMEVKATLDTEAINLRMHGNLDLELPATLFSALLTGQSTLSTASQSDKDRHSGNISEENEDEDGSEGDPEYRSDKPEDARESGPGTVCNLIQRSPHRNNAFECYQGPTVRFKHQHQPPSRESSSSPRNHHGSTLSESPPPRAVFQHRRSRKSTLKVTNVTNDDGSKYDQPFNDPPKLKFKRLSRPGPEDGDSLRKSKKKK